MKNRHAPPRRQVRRAKPTRIYRFTAPPLTTSSPLLGTSAMQTVVEPIAMNLTMAAPELGASVLRQLHRFKALPLETAPLSPSEEPERVHHLKARGIGQLPAKRPDAGHIPRPKRNRRLLNGKSSSLEKVQHRKRAQISLRA